MKSVLNVLSLIMLLALYPPGCWSDKGESGSVAPHIIDDFSGNAVDRAKWNIASEKSPSGLFSQSENRLKFSVTAGGGTLQSTQSFGPGFYTMQFFNYSSTNTEEPGSHKGAFAGLGLGPKDNFVRIIRCQNGHRTARKNETPYIGVFEANFIDNARGGIQVFYARTQVTSGRLGLYYDGSQVTFYFNPDPYSDKGWQTMKQSGGNILRWDPHWTEPPSLFIRGFDPSGITSFQAGNVEYKPTPPEAD
jgi:hypothetical protein